jgi:hypothetical protein
VKIARLKGEFEITPQAQLAYEKWYIPFRKSYEHKPDRSGVSGRIHTSVLKLAMVLTVNDTGKLVIDEAQILASIKLCLDLIPNYQSLVMASGKSTISEVAALLVEDIWQSKEKRISKAEFLGRYTHIFDSELCNKCTTTLLEGELIQFVLDGNKEYYRLTEKAIDKWGLSKKGDAAKA